MTRTINNLKTAFLLAALFGLLVFVGSFWGPRGMIIAGTFAVFLNFGAWYASDKIAIAAMRGREIDPGTPGGADLHAMVERLAARAGLPTPRVYICPQDAPNAFATGRSPHHAAVAVTRGALRLLEPDELEGVLGHELAHIRNRDTLTSTIAATVAGLFSMMAQMFLFFGLGGRREGGNALAMLGVIILGALGAALIKAMVSRSREFVADADGARFAGSPRGLASALRKLDAYAKQIPLDNPNPAMNNLFIVEPFVGATLTRLFASHPPTEQRIAALLRDRVA